MLTGATLGASLYTQKCLTLLVEDVCSYRCAEEEKLIQRRSSGGAMYTPASTSPGRWALMWRRKLKLKSKFESGSSHVSFKRSNQARFKHGFRYCQPAPTRLDGHDNAFTLEPVVHRARRGARLQIVRLERHHTGYAVIYEQ